MSANNPTKAEDLPSEFAEMSIHKEESIDFGISPSK